MPNNFVDEAMGCAQETFMGILSYLHREHINPNYVEEYILADKDGRFMMDEKLDKQTCSPTCASHQTFGIETCEIISCKDCNEFIEIKSALAPEYIHNMYATEILALQDQSPGEDTCLPEIILRTIENTNQFHSERLNNKNKMLKDKEK